MFFFFLNHELSILWINILRILFIYIFCFRFIFSCRLCGGHISWSITSRTLSMLFETRHPSTNDVHWGLFAVWEIWYIPIIYMFKHTSIKRTQNCSFSIHFSVVQYVLVFIRLTNILFEWIEHNIFFHYGCIVAAAAVVGADCVIWNVMRFSYYIFRALVEFMTAPNEILRRRVYNVTAMSFTPEELVDKLIKYVRELRVTYQPDSRQNIGK